MTPANAILLTFVLPGSAHAVLGKPIRGLVAMLMCVGMFFAGWAILGDRLFHCVLFEPFAFLAHLVKFIPFNLLPEAANLGCTVAANLLRDMPDNPAAMNEALRMVRLPQEMEHLGFFLTTASGLAACFWAADAQSLALQSPPAQHNRALVAGMSWLLPGSGHYVAGQRDKAYLMGGAVILTFLIGLVASDFVTVDRGLHNAYWIPQSLFGGGILASGLGLGAIEIPDPIPQRYSLGYTLTAVAGLMNLVVMIDAYTVVDKAARKEATP
jgi:hypothetical protein